ncbi:hypothetical protein ACFV19_14775 [Streptomyces griseoluteus]|uniref:hypothetical protein n=1 Tax=Streptomyces griseoluteus TaxID=29306 RepID=UPI0036CC3F6D
MFITDARAADAGAFAWARCSRSHGRYAASLGVFDGFDFTGRFAPTFTTGVLKCGPCLPHAEAGFPSAATATVAGRTAAVRAATVTAANVPTDDLLRARREGALQACSSMIPPTGTQISAAPLATGPADAFT